MFNPQNTPLPSVYHVLFLHLMFLHTCQNHHHSLIFHLYHMMSMLWIWIVFQFIMLQLCVDLLDDYIELPFVTLHRFRMIRRMKMILLIFSYCLRQMIQIMMLRVTLIQEWPRNYDYSCFGLGTRSNWSGLAKSWESVCSLCFLHVSDSFVKKSCKRFH